MKLFCHAGNVINMPLRNFIALLGGARRVIISSVIAGSSIRLLVQRPNPTGDSR